MVIIVPIVVAVQEYTKEKKIVAIQKHKKTTSKRNPRNSKPGKIYRFQH
jgi:hypothetical protein